MAGSEDLALFAHLVRKPESELDLERVALLIAETEYPGLDVARYVARLDELGAMARTSLRAVGIRPGCAPASTALTAIARLLYGRLGFRGNVGDYYDPRNSFLNDVLDRRTGIPITLALVLMGVARRAGLALEGVSFPCHFLVRASSDVSWGVVDPRRPRRPPTLPQDARVRARTDGCNRSERPQPPGRAPAPAPDETFAPADRPETERPMFVDPFDGRILCPEALQGLWEHATTQPGPIDERALQPARRRQILARMLNNLRAIHEVRGDGPRLCQVLARLAIVSPSEEMQNCLERAQVSPPAPRISIN